MHGFDRPNLRLGVEPKADWRRQLLDFLAARRNQAGIVYCLSRRLTEEVAAFLTKEGIRALPYHAGLSPEVRRANQQAFMAEEGVAMVATIAFGMGIDKPDIRYVFHLNLPGSVEAYYQEIGRAGRDGAPAEVQMVYGLDDIRMRRQFIDQDGEDEDHRRREHRRMDALLAYCEAMQCRRVTLLASTCCAARRRRRSARAATTGCRHTAPVRRGRSISGSPFSARPSPAAIWRSTSSAMAGCA